MEQLATNLVEMVKIFQFPRSQGIEYEILCTTLQSLMNAKLGQQRSWPCNGKFVMSDSTLRIRIVDSVRHFLSVHSCITVYCKQHRRGQVGTVAWCYCACLFPPVLPPMFSCQTTFVVFVGGSLQTLLLASLNLGTLDRIQLN